MNTKNENVEILITKAELLEKTNEIVNKKIAELKQHLADSLLAGNSDFLNVNSNQIKERIRVYQKIGNLIEEIVNLLFEKEQQCQNEN